MEDAPTYAQNSIESGSAAPPLAGAAGEGNPHLTSQYPPINDARLAMIREWVIEARRVHHYDPQNHSAHHYAYAVPELLQALAVASAEAAEAKERVGIQGVRIADLSKRNEILADDSHSSGREIAALRARLQEETRAAAEQRMLADAMRENLESYRLLLPKADERYAAEVAAHAETSAAYTGALKEWKEAAGNADRLLRERNAARQEAAEAEREKLALHEELRGLRAGLQEIRTRLSFADAPKWLRDKLRADLLELIEPKSEGVGPLVGGEGKEGQNGL